MNKLVKEIINTGYVFDEVGNRHKLTSAVDTNEGLFMQEFIKRDRLCTTLEVGCAMGISSLFICDALSTLKAEVKHIIIDPHQSTQWHNIGVGNLRKAGYNFFELIERPSEFALPFLLEQGMRIDFAFIDGWHTFDHTLLDFFYLQRMLNVGGIILIDDVRMKSINKVVRYILQFPHIKYLASANTYNENHLGWRHVIKECGKSVLGLLASTFVGKSNAAVILDDSVLRSDRSLGLNASMMAFQKVGEDFRGWDWYSKF